ncbi:unnamed protein product [Chironomus riparius]|uniref:Uncharacterized protein n=1 Tax=Chironomus riparius TaxID=315576 RepID=A0A9N9WYI6_9DIPT|nr:unnamed protein product [Chironomus riparius]
MKKTYFCITIFIINTIIVTLESSNVNCVYGYFGFHAVTSKYRCLVSNSLNISSQDSAQIDAVNGTHLTNKTNNDEIFFHASSRHIEYFPKGLEKFFTNLTGIVIWYSKLKEIHQDDLKAYTKLNYLFLSTNNIEIIEDGLFDFQPDIQVIKFEDSKIFHISSSVFDNLSKLTTLSLAGNSCTNLSSTNNRAGVLEVIKSVISTCISSDFSKLDEKLKNLEEGYKNLNLKDLPAFLQDLESFKDDVNQSKFAKSKALKSRIIMISFLKMSLLSEVNNAQSAESDRINRKINNLEAMLNELNKKTIINNHWMIGALVVIGLILTVILVIVFKRFRS